MSDRTGVLVLTLAARGDGGWPVGAELRRVGELPLLRDGLLNLDLAELAALTDPLAYGRALGEALFAGPIGDAWALARARCPDRLHVAIRLADADLRALEWETLQAPIDGRPVQLRLDQRTPLAIEVASESERSFPALTAADLRALVVVTSPTDLADYGLTHFDTLAALQCARAAIAPIPCDVLAFGIPDAKGPPTLEALCARLTAERYALLHIVCHGAYARGRGDTVLYLADDDETTAPVPADKLLRRLARLGGEVGLPHLAFLCACESAAPESERALGGLGHRLVRELGLPAAVAMTDKISVDTATELIGPFYHQLAAHGLPDLALAEASTQIAERRDIAAPLAFVRAAGVSLLAETGPKDQPSAAPPIAAPPPIFAASTLPLSLGPGFVGRDADLAELARLLSSETGTCTSAVALVGAAGFGKTRLALEFLWRERARFPGGIFWLSGADDERRHPALHRLLTLLDPSTPPLDVLRARGETPGPRLAAAVRAFRPGSAKLWVIEDIPEPVPGAGPFDLQAWCPAWGEVAVLAVSRARLPDSAIHHHELAPLGLEAGAALLAAAAGSTRVEPDLARALAEWVGGLPLALELLGKSLALGDLSADDLRELVAGGSVAQALGEAEAVVDQAGGGNFGLLSALRASYQSLTPEAQRLARLLAQLGPDPLPMALVKAFGAEASRPARAALIARSFVTGLSGHVFGTMHRVLADFLRGARGSDEPPRACEVLWAGNPAEELERPQRWPELDAWAAHADALLMRSRGGELEVDLALRVGRLYLNQDRIDEALRVEMRAVALADASLPPDHPARLVARLLVAAALHDRGDQREALALQEQALAALLHARGEQDMLAMGAQTALAQTLRDVGERRRSLEMYQTLVGRWRQQFGPDAELTLSVELGLALTHLADDDYAAALAAVEPLLPRLRAVEGEDGLSSLTAAAVRGNALFGLGRPAEARAVLEDTLAAAQRILGPDHSLTLDVGNSLIYVLRGQGELVRARDLARDVQARFVRRFGPAHPQALSCAHHVARLEGTLGNWPRAHAVIREAAEVARARLGPRHPIAIALRHELGIAAMEIDALDEARAALTEAVDLLEGTAGPDHISTLRARAALAHVQILAGDPASGRDVLAVIATDLAARLGDDHPEVLTLRNNFGLALLSLGDAAGAADLYQDLVARSRRVLGDAHLETLQRVLLLSRARLDAGDPAGARALAEANLAAIERAFPADAAGPHSEALGQRVILASALRALGLPAEAEAHARVALTGQRARLPPGHSRIRDALLALGLCLSDQDRIDDAYPLLAEAEPLCARQCGETHPATASVRFDLAAIDLRRGDAAGAAARLTALLPLLAQVWGPDSLYTLLAEHNLALAHSKLGDLPAALARLRDLVPRARAALGDHPAVAGFAQNLANLEAKAAKA